MNASNGQYKLREMRKLIDRLENGQRMLHAELEKGSITKCIDIVSHFVKVNQELLHRAEELVLIEHFALTGTKTFINRNGKLIDGTGFIEERHEITPSTLLMLDKLKEIFGSIPHDILEITKE